MVTDGVSSAGVEKKHPPKTQTVYFMDIVIAIDAGHTAGNNRRRRSGTKVLKFQINPDHGLMDSIQLAEGILT